MTKTYLKYRTRITVLAGFIILSWAGLCIRLFQVQVLNGERYQIAVVNQTQKKQILPSNRGNIFDRENRPFTRNIIHYTLSVKPSKVTDKLGLATAISERTGQPIEKYLNKLNSNSNFEHLERNIQRETLGTLETSNFDGLNIKRDYRRYYPHNQMAAQILGFTNVDDKGISGIEKDFNSYLTGTAGWVYKTKGWSGKIQHKSGMPFQSPIDGCNIQLTLDLEYQSILEEELTRRQKETGAVSATGIIMNPQTGEILAMSSTPGFDNNKYSKSLQETHRIRSITDQFEPGSTFKIVTAVAALSDNKIDLVEEFNCENGEFEYHDIKVTDHEEYGMLTLSQIIQYSSNIGVVKVIERVGRKTLYQTSRSFGFGSLSGISLAGETVGKLKPIKKWSAVSNGQTAMGYEVGVSAIQLAVAYCAIANGGYLITPSIVRQIINHNQDIVYAEETSIIRKIADEKTMENIREMLRGVIVNGTGHNAEISGWDVAGKTGTAQKWKDGKYSNDKFISNFVGFFPYKEPQLLAFIMLDEPNRPYHWGSEGAAVAFKRVMKRIINMDDDIIPPARKEERIEYANNTTKMDFIIREEESIATQTSTLPLGLLSVARYSNKVEMPEVRGFSMRKAMTTLRTAGLKINIQGSGKVAWQSPRPGTILNKGQICIVGLK
ncbi:MAG: transpeptidase family protein [Candidatus Marinimicrobia bacterium]|jgi:cell division protein FtsI/penicillin-binding protein 2|nr:transpeptidase family protein [Candidatus Neomarinimicrobiota bacterium]MBT3501529.1 transpeptidase family protein [Candidatus Neomarinimicrobiota bacterium]MBT5462136.1 transpeptidase family protein [Candidatus Neomarinimicrobiota bacterium]MBT7277366.1 transpeptidase family protein [Candidatus Neomarinimicrobiota bacterium]MBT7823434.1 transpeptidase family protein [Candidatus Neomarinimicrobiota bacterium]